MESLYVCLFSNGHIKVGISDKPEGRIQDHATRVACVGVTLKDKAVFLCNGVDRTWSRLYSQREGELIERCAEAAESRHHREWFTGLHFPTVCDWAAEIAAKTAQTYDLSTFGGRLTKCRRERGLTQAELGKGLGTDGADCGKQVVYGWEKDQHYPRVDQLMLICKRLNCSADYLLGIDATEVF